MPETVTTHPSLSRALAENQARGLTLRRGRRYRAVLCNDCLGWHVEGTSEIVKSPTVGFQGGHS